MPTILLKKSDTPGSVPGTANLTNLAGGVEVAVNTADKRVYSMTSASAVIELGTNPSSLTCADASFTVARVGSLTISSLSLTNVTVTSATVTTLTGTSANITNISGTSLTVSTATLSGGTANGVLYLNGSKVATSGSALVFDGTNVGLGVTPSAWGSTFRALQMTGAASIAGTTDPSLQVSQNAYYNGTNWIYSTTAAASNYNQAGGVHAWRTAASGTAGTGISWTQAMTLDASGNLLIGQTTNTQNYRLVIKGSAGTADDLAFNSDATRAEIQSFNSKPLALNRQGNNVLICTDAGNLGIGTSSPAAKLHVVGDSLSNTFKLIANTAVSGSDATIFRPADNTMAFSTNGTERARISSDGTFRVKGAGTAGSTDAFLVDGAAPASAARITSGGNFLVGTDNAAENAGPGMKVLNTGGTVALVSTVSDSSQQGFEMYSTGAAAYRLYVNYAGTIHATNTTISAISDQRYKENICDLDVGLDAVLALKPRKFDWKTGKGKDIKNDRGFIAQEFEQVFPDLVDEWKDPAPEGEEPYKSVRQDLIPVLVKAIQELTARVAQLESK